MPVRQVRLSTSIVQELHGETETCSSVSVSPRKHHITCQFIRAGISQCAQTHRRKIILILTYQTTTHTTVTRFVSFFFSFFKDRWGHRYIVGENNCKFVHFQECAKTRQASPPPPPPLKGRFSILDTGPHFQVS